MQTGIFTISLDFELYWGVRDGRSLDSYRRNLSGGRAAVPLILDMFAHYDIHATWAIVGMIMCENRAQLLSYVPSMRPSYSNPALSPYAHIETLGDTEREDPWHYGASLVNMIQRRGGQEIGTHTFSHYYCLEPGQTLEEFRHDMTAAMKAGNDRGITLRSLVFPRDQFSPDHLRVCIELGITAYRCNPPHWMYAPAAASTKQSAWRRAARILDAYIPISGHNCYPLKELAAKSPGSAHSRGPDSVPDLRGLSKMAVTPQFFAPAQTRIGVERHPLVARPRANCGLRQ